MKKRIFVVVLTIIILAVAYVIFNHEWINLKILTSKEHVLMAYDYDGAFSVFPAVYPGSSSVYTNITEDRMLYRYNDKGYNIDDIEKFVYLNGKKINQNQVTKIVSAVENLVEVSTEELWNSSNSERKYTMVQINDSRKVVYTEEFQKIIEKYI